MSRAFKINRKSWNKKHNSNRRNNGLPRSMCIHKSANYKSRGMMLHPCGKGSKWTEVYTERYFSYRIHNINITCWIVNRRTLSSSSSSSSMQQQHHNHLTTSSIPHFESPGQVNLIPWQNKGRKAAGHTQQGIMTFTAPPISNIFHTNVTSIRAIQETRTLMKVYMSHDSGTSGPIGLEIVLFSKEEHFNITLI